MSFYGNFETLLKMMIFEGQLKYGNRRVLDGYKIFRRGGSGYSRGDQVPWWGRVDLQT